MKKISLILVLSIVVIACKQEIKVDKKITIAESKQAKESNVASASIPQDIKDVFKAHGGLDAFNKKSTLIFELVNPEGNEKHTTDLSSRYARIETDKFALGFDGKDAWLVQDSTYFKGNPRFYHNLMFYFYAMPFVVGDDGIVFEKVEDLLVHDVAYPGYKISYENGVGDSPKDNYFLYYDSTTKKMKFLGYTVTFFSKEVSQKVSLIDYAEWEDIDGVLLPKTLKWMEYVDGKVGAVKSERNFVNASLINETKEVGFYSKPKPTK